MIPQTLDSWTLDAIRSLLVQGYYEQEHFDYKRSLPHTKNDFEKLGLRKDCCGFANSSGGFLVFGVKDDRSLSVDDRLEGIDRALDFPVLFGDQARLCNPSVKWSFKNPPISLPNGNFIHVVHIPQSWQGPHALVDSSKGELCFTKRTNKGNEAMAYEEVRLAFLGLYERRLKLQLLVAELEHLRNRAEGLVIPESDELSMIPTLTLSSAVIESVLIDAYLILKDYPLLLSLLMRLRGQVDNINQHLVMMQSVAYLPLTNKEGLVQKHNRNLRLLSFQLAKTIEEASSGLREVLG